MRDILRATQCPGILDESVDRLLDLYQTEFNQSYAPAPAAGQCFNELVKAPTCEGKFKDAGIHRRTSWDYYLTYGCSNLLEQLLKLPFGDEYRDASAACAGGGAGKHAGGQKTPFLASWGHALLYLSGVAESSPRLADRTAAP